MNKKIKEASVWVKKYLIADSEPIMFLLSIIKGIKDIKLISSPIHIPNQEEDEIVNRLPKIIIIKKIIFEI